MAVKNDRVALLEMAMRVAALDPRRFPDVQIREREERKERFKALPKTLMNKLRELSRLVQEKSRREIPPRLMEKIREFGKLVQKYRSPEVPELSKAEELIWRDPEKLEKALSLMSPEDLKALEQQTIKSLGAIGHPFWDD